MPENETASSGRELLDAAHGGEVPLWAFVANHLTVECSLPSELVAGHILREARPDEIEQITRAIPGLDTMSRLPIHPPSKWYIVERIKKSDWIGLNEGFAAIQDASRLTSAPLDLSLFFVGGQYSIGGTIGAIPFAQLSALNDRPRIITDAYVHDLREIHLLIRQGTQSHEEIKRALDLFRIASAIDPHHLLYALGLFVVIEFLLTHNPHGRYDGLSHQVATKIPLLERRFAQPLDYSLFAAAEKSEVWRKLYEYRSRIAHGGQLDFSRELKPLRGHSPARDFLLQATRGVLRNALTEPELVLDLRAV
jgi:hypothetical protein